MPAAVADHQAECARMLAKHPNAVPIVLASSGKSNFLALAPTATVADVAAAVRDVASIPARKPVALTVDGCVPAPTTTVAELYAACKSADGFLHVSYTAERRMGIAAAGPCFAAGGELGSPSDIAQGVANDAINNATGGAGLGSLIPGA